MEEVFKTPSGREFPSLERAVVYTLEEWIGEPEMGDFYELQTYGYEMSSQEFFEIHLGKDCIKRAIKAVKEASEKKL